MSISSDFLIFIPHWFQTTAASKTRQNYWCFPCHNPTKSLTVFLSLRLEIILLQFLVKVSVQSPVNIASLPSRYTDMAVAFSKRLKTVCNSGGTCYCWLSHVKQQPKSLLMSLLLLVSPVNKITHHIAIILKQSCFYIKQHSYKTKCNAVHSLYEYITMILLCW